MGMGDAQVTGGDLQRESERLHSEIHAAEGRGVAHMGTVIQHFDQRLKDSERILTWRMVAVGAVSSFAASGIELLARGSDSKIAQAAATLWPM